jgi:acyl-coenzyme A thioesterase PaaI-like protein
MQARMSDGARENLQDRYAPKGVCFGCGSANREGLQIKSVVKGDETVAVWTPQPKYRAFENVLCGGIIGTLLDCHSNWTGAYQMMLAGKRDAPPCTVTAEYGVKLRRPTPMTGEITLRARAVEVTPDRVVVEATLEAEGKVCATSTGVFVAVKPGHPAYHRW